MVETLPGDKQSTLSDFVFDFGDVALHDVEEDLGDGEAEVVVVDDDIFESLTDLFVVADFFMDLFGDVVDFDKGEFFFKICIIKNGQKH